MSTSWTVKSCVSALGWKWQRILQQLYADTRPQTFLFTHASTQLRQKGVTHQNPRTASLTGVKGRTWRSDRCVWARSPAPPPSSKSGRTSFYLSSSDIKWAELEEKSEGRQMRNLLEHLLVLTVCSAASEALLKFSSANRRARWAATSQWVFREVLGFSQAKGSKQPAGVRACVWPGHVTRGVTCLLFR